jgi:hypothetical protein
VLRKYHCINGRSDVLCTDTTIITNFRALVGDSEVIIINAVVYNRLWSRDTHICMQMLLGDGVPLLYWYVMAWQRKLLRHTFVRTHVPQVSKRDHWSEADGGLKQPANGKALQRSNYNISYR